MGSMGQDLTFSPGAGGCPSADVLSAFSSGRLAEADLVTVADHAAHCLTCDESLRSLSFAGDPLSQRLRAAVALPWPVEEPACLRMQASVKTLGRRLDDSFLTDTQVDAGSGESHSVPPLAPALQPPVTPPAETLPPPMPTAIGRYQVRSLLGRGGFGDVYLAHDPDLDRLVAIKVPKFSPGANQAAKGRFLREAQTAARLKHPGVVAIHEIVREGEHAPYIVMEHVEGSSLRDMLKRGKLTMDEAVRIVSQAAETLHAAHKQGLVHRDLKPGNILFDADGRVKLADFGLAVHEDRQRSLAGERSGTLAYMSPEQVRGDVHRLDGRSDIWSLGVLLYELLTERRPFGGTLGETADEILNRPARPPRQIDDRVPPALEQICLKCLSKDADLRYPTAGDLAAALANWRPGPATQTGWHRRPGILVGIVAAAAVLFLAAIVVIGKSPRYPYPVDVEARPQIWLSLMSQPPEEFVPATGDGDRWFFNRQFRQLTMDARTAQILGLGETRHGAYELQVKISKNAPDGRSGVFLGLEPLSPVNGLPRYAAQIVAVDVIDGHEMVVRDRVEIKQHKSLAWGISKFRLATVHITPGPFNNELLTIAVRGNGVEEVRWRGQSLPELSDRQVSKRHGPAPTCIGRFGVVNGLGTTTFSDAEFKSLQPVPP